MLQFRCLYTGAFVPETQRSEDHVVPYSIGGPDRFVIGCVSRDANSRVGTEIEAPFAANVLIAGFAQRAGVVGRTGRPTRVVIRDGSLSFDGREHDVNLVRDLVGWSVEFLNRKREDRDPETGVTSVTWNVAPEDAESTLATIQDRFLEKYGAVPIVEVRSAREDHPAINCRIRFDLVMFRSIFAKIALGFATYALGDAFAHSPMADPLRSALWARSPEAMDASGLRGPTWPGQIPPEVAVLLRVDDRHVLTLHNLRGRLWCGIMLFGQFDASFDLGELAPDQKETLGDGRTVFISPATRSMEERDRSLLHERVFGE